MTDTIRKYLYDILESAESIEKYIENIDFFQYQKNKMVRRAVEREFEIIGEATKALLKLNDKIKLSSEKRIIGMRNRVIHGYDKIDDGIIWGTIKNHLPVLKKEVKELLK
ncbi:Uncharacterized conserved protein, contains HEPN domain [Tangfeifania diversioriginum]|uniref:Uncharacterized conserved protein, contains HEPN domain n=1 Tax=Tangfeifania diversioriginum TaxID=1168035 RepID=A0A1M6JHU7_9BACT|nr:HepT-like ribonuclease domain-containing protein [Tangfeifania diversioriginum]SHJ46202.1 Uncharacterized conserved protein, contains HEPN domain [Tangfeifania diversioriginum]